MKKFMPRKNIKILVLGCGNAEFSEDLYDAGYENITNVDISPVCIQQMTVRNAIQRPNMSWKVGDVTNMEFKNSTFDLAIDKSTIDALLCGDDAYIMVGKMMKECQRVLKKGAHYFAISFGNPEARAHHFQSPFLSVTNFQYTIQDENATEDKTHYLYVWKKKADADRVSAANFDSWLRKEQGEDSEEEKQAEEAPEEEPSDNSQEDEPEEPVAAAQTNKTSPEKKARDEQRAERKAQRQAKRAAEAETAVAEPVVEEETIDPEV